MKTSYVVNFTADIKIWRFICRILDGTTLLELDPDNNPVLAYINCQSMCNYVD